MDFQARKSGKSLGSRKKLFQSCDWKTKRESRNQVSDHPITRSPDHPISLGKLKLLAGCPGFVEN
jgi:hypothetical protein